MLVTAAVWPISSLPYFAIEPVTAWTSTERSLWARAPRPDASAVAQLSVIDVRVACTSRTPRRIDDATLMDRTRPTMVATSRISRHMSRASSKLAWIPLLRARALARAAALSLSRLAIISVRAAAAGGICCAAAVVSPARASATSASNRI